MLFASSDGSFSFLVMMIFFLWGTGRAVKMISGNSTARSVATKGAFHLIQRLFK
jgi:hypothetical protein